MRHLLITLVILASVIIASAQRQTYVSAAFFTTQNAIPFEKFSGLLKETIHPGLEIGYGRILKPKEKHEWFGEVKMGYFYHRFVQHGLPLYLNFGYRYKFNSRLTAETSIGAGYMHSIPATAKLKLNEEGEYENNKGIGRMQAMATYAIGFSYVLNHTAAKTIRVFTSYQQRLQFPFVKSYVPLLPYNSFMIGLIKSK
ncbi:MAG: hypothetical protein IPL04_15600 [Chitinophagaceae bacterium]|nr:hypothetical protein [Chitinophagaceae bacterium]